MRFDPVEMAAEVVSRASREKPADQLLRETLKRQRDLPPFDAGEVSRLVFDCFRWHGWLPGDRPVKARLRRARELAELFERDPLRFPAEELRAKAVPRWVHEEVAADVEWLRTLQTRPKLWLRARLGQGRALTRKLGECRPAGAGPLSDALEYYGEKDLFRTPHFHAGDFELQDLSSQAVGWICDPRPGQTWWDACAGEGGKLLHLSDLMRNKGLIWASDRAEWRLQKLKRRAGRAGAFNYRAVPWDGGAKLPTRTKFDGILVDAPCSGVGTWQRNPHARWTTTRVDVKELAALQRQLLGHAAKALKPGGRLVYAVCTVTRAETDGVADAFESAFPEFKPAAVVNPLSPDEPRAARIWMWPQRTAGNGMFVAVWEKPAGVES